MLGEWERGREVLNLSLLIPSKGATLGQLSTETAKTIQLSHSSRVLVFGHRAECVRGLDRNDPNKAPNDKTKG